MQIGSKAAPVTEIAAANSEVIVIRGYDLCKDLIGQISFTDHVWLLVVGKMPTEPQRRVLDSTLVAIAEHGLVPSVAAARMTLAAGPDALQGAVAAGILGCGSVILGSSEVAGRFFHEIAAAVDTGQSLTVAITETVARRRAEKKAIPGYGHPVHGDFDPRAHRLMEIGRETGVAGRYMEIAYEVEKLLPELTGRPLKMNISGAIPAVLLDAGYPLLALKGAPILARTASLIGHLLEEQTRPIGFALADTGSASVTYTGPKPDYVGEIVP